MAVKTKTEKFIGWLRDKLYGMDGERYGRISIDRENVETNSLTKELILSRADDLDGKPLGEAEAAFDILKEKEGIDDRNIGMYLAFCDGMSDRERDTLSVEKAVGVLDREIAFYKERIKSVEELNRRYEGGCEEDIKALTDLCEKIDVMTPIVKYRLSKVTIGSIYDKWKAAENERLKNERKGKKEAKG